MLKIEWKKTQLRYSVDNACYVGDGVRVGHVYEPGQTRDYVGPRYAGVVILPGIKMKDGLLRATQDEAMKDVEMAVRKWFERCGWDPKAL